MACPYRDWIDTHVRGHEALFSSKAGGFFTAFRMTFFLGGAAITQGAESLRHE